MTHLLTTLDHGELLPLAVVVCLLACIGRRFATDEQRRFAQGLAAVAVLAYAARAVLLRTFSASGDLLDAILRSLLAGGIVYGLGLFMLPVVSAVADVLLWRPWAALRKTVRGTGDTLRAWRQRRLQRTLAKRLEPSPAEKALIAERARQQAEAQRRREDTRSACELFYHLFAPDLGERFPQAMFDDFLRRYMGDDRSPEYVEERALQLRSTIEQHHQKIDPPKKRLTLAEVAGWFLREKAQIDATPLGEDDKTLLLAQLEVRFAQLQEKIIRGLEP